MTKFDYLDKYYQRFINDIAKNSSHKSVTVIVLNGAKGANLNLVLNDFSKIGKIHQVSKSTAITESKLTKAFSNAHSNQESILFFDEADSLFGKRTEIKDSHDRYANIETSYLLKKIKNHYGLVILASNNRQSLTRPLSSEVNVLIEFPTVFTFIRKHYRRTKKRS